MTYNPSTGQYDAYDLDPRMQVSFEVLALEQFGSVDCWKIAERKFRKCGEHLPDQILVTTKDFRVHEMMDGVKVNLPAE